MPSLSVVIPAYNEAHRLPANLPRVVACLDALALPGGWELIVVVEKSRDDTAALTQAAAAGRAEVCVVANPDQRGKGYAVRCGMLRAAGDIVLFMDADLSTPLESVGRVLAHFAAHPAADAAIGNRRDPRSRIGVRQSWLRRSLSDAFNLAVRALVLPGLRDTQCGFKAFRARAAREIFSRQTLDGFSFDLEILELARSLGLRVDELPVDWCDEPASTLRPWRDGLRMLRDAMRVRRVVAKTLRGPR